MLLGIQVIAVLFALVMLYFTHLYYKRGNYSKKSFILWIAVWLGIVLLLVMPNTLQFAASLLSLSRVTDLYMTIAVLFLVTMTFSMYVSVKRMERKLEKFVRTQAIKRPKKKS